jgi:hypothetical protein
MHMKRIGSMFGLVFIGSLSVGCDSGIPAGAPAEMPKSAQTQEFKDMMKTAGEKMQRKGKGVTKKSTPAPDAESK